MLIKAGNTKLVVHKMSCLVSSCDLKGFKSEVSLETGFVQAFADLCRVLIPATRGRKDSV